jgi:hypothetical protein
LINKKKKKEINEYIRRGGGIVQIPSILKEECPRKPTK